MKKTILVLIAVVLLTACKSANGNSISKLETTIYKNNNHDTLVIEDGFEAIKKIFTDEDTFYYSSLLTIEYGDTGTKELEDSLKEQVQAFDVLYFKFSFMTGDVAYQALESNHLYNYTVYLIKSFENDEWHIYNMDSIPN